MITSISQRIIDAITAKGVNVEQSFAGHEIEVEMTWYSPAGQDVNQTITVNTDTVSSQCDVDQSFAQQLEDLYEDYDPSAEAYLWLSDGRDGKTAGHGKNGVPDTMGDVYADFCTVEKRLEELSNAVECELDGIDYDEE